MFDYFCFDMNRRAVRQLVNMLVDVDGRRWRQVVDSLDGELMDNVDVGQLVDGGRRRLVDHHGFCNWLLENMFDFSCVIQNI